MGGVTLSPARVRNRACLGVMSGVDREFREVVGAFATGVCVVTSEHHGHPAGMTLNSFTSVSLEPLLVLVSLAHGSRTLEKATASRRFAVNILHRKQQDVALDFAKRGADFPVAHAMQDRYGYFAVRHALALLRCEVTDIVRAGDHDLVIGEVASFEGSGGEPLVFHRGTFGGLDADAHVPSGRVIGLDNGTGW
jgi:flavin reductase (DIM6/NTAB) family NADH-FMN oxidoreductase RutF